MEIHPIAQVFPQMSETELADLGNDIKDNGQREPIWIYEGQILDGRNRYLAMESLGLTPLTRDYTGTDPIGFVVSKNLHRRHLDASARAIASAKIANLKNGSNQHLTKELSSDSAQNKEDLGAKEGMPNGIPSDFAPVTVEDASKLTGSSIRSTMRAKKVLQDGSKELIEAVESGDIKVGAAAEIAELPKEEQVKVVKRKLAKEELAEESEQDPREQFNFAINKLCKDLDGFKSRVKELSETECGKYIHCESVTQSLDAARQALWQSRPTESCNCTKHTGKSGNPHPECKACFGTGWMPKCRRLKAYRGTAQ